MFNSDRTETRNSDADTIALMQRRGRPEKSPVHRYPNRIRELRSALCKSQEWLADQVHTTPANVSKKERGDRRLTLDEMPLYAKALGCSVADLLPGEAMLSEPEKALIAYFRLMDSEQHKQLMKFAAFLLNSRNRDVAG